ncbi:MAG TPA: T9SS type A sorting domain-containing protein [Bacteroidia bacterium]|jgi:hypothetical protein|nr:T9SS type A sorting domain-containing protein [Bacteroidia bacterium]
MLRLLTAILLACTCLSAGAQVLNLPARSPSALDGTQFVATINSPSLSLTNRENMIYTQISNGNVPTFFRNLVPVTSSAVISGVTESVTYYVAPDYLMVGTDTNYFLCPMSPMLATKIADLTGCTLPTRKMVNDIYGAATVKLSPSTIPPSSAMTTVPVFDQENTTVWGKRKAVISTHPLGELTGGDKKDVVISNMIYTTANRVVIYGWHTSVGNPIQPMTNVHADTYMDYSHGIRLVQNSVMYNGSPTTVKAILQSSTLNTLLSDEGSMTKPWYPYGLTTGIEETVVNADEPVFYPNPMQSEATLAFNLSSEEQVKAEVYDATGRTVMQLADQIFSEGPHQLTFERGALPAGLYFISLRSATQSKNLRFLVVN